MLSRAALLSAVQRPAALMMSRGCTSAPQKFERPVRREHPGAVRLGFIPEEWFQFFYPKTGVTGPYVFGAGLVTYLLSKEIYILEHEFYNGLSLAIMVWYGIKKLGPQVAAYCDKEIDAIEDAWKEGRQTELKSLSEAIESEKKEQWRADGQVMLMEAKKENVALQLEAAYRDRLMHVYKEVKRRLDYQVERENIERRMSQKQLVDWVVDSVVKSITPDQEKENLNRCIADLGLLATKAK